MPTYEYQCRNCGERFELFQSFKAKPLKRHDVCGGDLQKVFHPTGIVFKGSGFYINDSREKSSKSSAAGDGANESKTDAKEAKTDIKESKTEGKNGSTKTDSDGGKKVEASKAKAKSE